MKSRRLLVLARADGRAPACFRPPRRPADHPLDAEQRGDVDVRWPRSGPRSASSWRPIRRFRGSARTCSSWPTCRWRRGGARGANDTASPDNAADIELAGDYAFVGSYTQGLVIVNISSCNDPSSPPACKPFVQSVLKCSGGQFDVQLSPDASYVVLAHESASANKACHPGEEGVQVIDVSEQERPEARSPSSATRSRRRLDRQGRGRRAQRDPGLAQPLHRPVHPDLPGRPTCSAWPTRSKPRSGSADFTQPGPERAVGPHDSIPDHRPDGRDLLYAASIQKSDIIDIDRPHQAEDPADDRRPPGRHLPRRRAQLQPQDR